MVQKLIDNGYSLIRLGKKNDIKAPLDSWGKYQKERVTDVSFFKDNYIGLVCGEISGNVFCIDIDLKYDNSYTLYEDLTSVVNNIDDSILKKICINRTLSGGYHWIFKLESKPPGSTKIAWREATEDEKAKGDKMKCLIETKGEGGYIAHPPFPGYSHISGDINLISDFEFNILLDCCRAFNQIEPEIKTYNPVNQKTNNYLKSPFEDYDERGDCLLDLKNHGWIEVFQRGERVFFRRPGETKTLTSANYHVSKKRFKVFSTSTEFDSAPGIAYSPSGVYTMLNHNGDHKKSSQDLLSKGYGKKRNSLNPKFERDVIKLKRNNYEKDYIIPELMKTHNLPLSEIEENLRLYDENKGVNILRFWNSELQKDGTNKIDISRYDFYRFLTDELNIYRYKLDEESDGYTFIKITNNIIDNIGISDIKNLVKDYLEKLSFVFDGVYRDALIEVMIRQSKSIYSSDVLDFMELADIKILRSTENKAYFPFKNGIVEVSKHYGIQLLKYQDMGEYFIFRNNIINHEFIIENDFYGLKFIEFINKINGDVPERIQYCREIIGYLLHDYRDPLKPYSVVFGEETSDSKDGGGAGKGILVKALGFLQKSVTIDGKSLNLNDTFPFQRVNLDTKIVLLQDTLESFNFEKLFVKATDGFSVRKLYKSEVLIPYEDSPKFLITTNYTVDNSTVASRRRLKLLEFSSFFNDKMTPFMHFGERLFNGWDNKTWNKFYNWMLLCAHTYLENDINEVKESYKSLVKRISTKYTPDFLTWFQRYELNELKPYVEVYGDFLKSVGLDEKGYSKKRFSHAIAYACECFNYKYTKREDPISKSLSVYWGSEVKEIKQLEPEEFLF